MRINKNNVALLGKFDFVFVAVDKGPARNEIVNWLSLNQVPFVDCGMGLNRCPDGLNGVVRVTGVDRQAYEQNAGTVFLPITDPKDGEYRRQGQIAELNALNASLAVIWFKQHFEIYEREDPSTSIIFETSSFDVSRPENAQ